MFGAASADEPVVFEETAHVLLANAAAVVTDAHLEHVAAKLLEFLVNRWLIAASKVDLYLNIPTVVCKLDGVLEQVEGHLDDAAFVTADPSHAILKAVILDRHLNVFVLCFEGNNTNDFVKWLMHFERTILAFEFLHPKCRQIHSVLDKRVY